MRTHSPSKWRGKSFVLCRILTTDRFSSTARLASRARAQSGWPSPSNAAARRSFCATILTPSPISLSCKNSVRRSRLLLRLNDRLRLFNHLLRQLWRTDNGNIAALVEDKVHDLNVVGVADGHQPLYPTHMGNRIYFEVRLKSSQSSLCEHECHRRLEIQKGAAAKLLRQPLLDLFS